MINYDIVVVGGGPAGLAAAISAKEEGAENILVIERDRELGGILNQCIHNGFGIQVFKEELTGPEYAQRFINQLEEMNIDYKLDTMVLDISPEKEVTCMNTEDGLMHIKAKAVVLAMGCRERSRGALNLAGTRPVGVYNAGLAQRLINMEGYMVGKKVIILGSGDIGLIMARRLVLEGAEVIGVLARGSYAAGLSRNVVQCLEDFDIPLMLQHNIVKVNGKERVKSVVIAETDKNKRPIKGTEVEYECDTVLLSVGLIPENELSKGVGIDLDRKTGGAVVNETMETEVEGIFACGNVLHVHDVVDYVTEESRKAGKSAAQYVKGTLKKEKDYINLNPGEGIGYIVPQMINRENLEEPVELFLRVRDIYENAKLVVKLDGEEIRCFKRRYMMPSEMEKMILKPELFEGNKGNNLTIEVVREMNNMATKEMVCIVCPIGCHLEVTEDKSVEGGYKVEGGTCKRGKIYGVKELTSPTRLLTSTVKIVGGDLPRLPVRTKEEVPKGKILECMKIINEIEVKAPIRMGDVLLENILDTGVDIIATRNLN